MNKIKEKRFEMFIFFGSANWRLGMKMDANRIDN